MDLDLSNRDCEDGLKETLEGAGRVQFGEEMVKRRHDYCLQIPAGLSCGRRSGGQDPDKWGGIAAREILIKGTILT